MALTIRLQFLVVTALIWGAMRAFLEACGLSMAPSFPGPQYSSSAGTGYGNTTLSKLWWLS
jgi:hypothetical protein